MSPSYVLDREQLKACAVALDTEAENLDSQMALNFHNQRVYRRLSERRSKLWRAAKLLREIVEGV